MGLQALGLYTDDDFVDGKLKEGIPVPQLGGEVRPGDIKYRDMNNDGYITSADEGYIGSTTDRESFMGLAEISISVIGI